MTAAGASVPADNPSSPRGTSLTGAMPLLGLASQLGLAILVIRAFALEGPRFEAMFLLAAGGFLIHAVLPQALRLPWFLLLSLLAIGATLGWSDGLWLVTIGLALIALTHLPVRWAVRAGLVVAAAVSLVVFREVLATPPFPASVWPVLGSMFMFRLIVYLHHLKHHPGRPALGQTLAYFFMLPNVAFPLFPVVDYKTFATTWYDQEATAIYQTGLRSIARGLLHLVLYRFVYFHVARDPITLTDLADLFTYVVSTFLLYLRVSGQFHLIVGILQLFGYRLPRSNNNYFLATSFTEVWQRINIYWKDFMMKLVYYPSFFVMRRWGQRAGLIGATLMVFLVTWLLHSYQWYWLRGDFPITAPDGLFWGIIGAAMVMEMARRSGGAARPQPQRGWSASRALRTVGFFLGFSVLWALWESETTGDFLSLWRLGLEVDVARLGVIAMILAAAVAVTGWTWGRPALDRPAGRKPWQRDDVQTVVTCLGLLALAQPVVTDRLGARLTTLAQSLRQNGLNARDAAARQRGYYEQLNAVGGVGGAQLPSVRGERPVDWDRLGQSPAFRRRPDLMGGELLPNMSVTFKDVPLTTNSWGMRDQEYALAKPAGTFRVALLGPSDVMGSGVAGTETFEARLEDRLNLAGAPATRRYEVLNFAVGGYDLLAQMEQLRQRVFQFTPDLVMATHHPRTDDWGAGEQLARAVRLGATIADTALRRLVLETGVTPETPAADAARRLRPHGAWMVRYALQQIRDAAAAHGVPVILLVMVLPGESLPPEQPAVEEAERIGFQVVDLRDVFNGRDPATLRITSWDQHPNVQGHQLIADRLYTELVERRRILPPPVP